MGRRELADELAATLESDENLDEYWADDGTVDPPKIDGLTHVNRVLRRLARLDGEAAEIDGLCDDEIRRINAFRADRKNGIHRQYEWLADGLEAWTRAYEQETGAKTVRLPCGWLQLRKAQPKVEITDDSEATLTELRTLGLAALIVTKESISRSDVAKVVKAGVVRLGPESGPPDEDGYRRSRVYTPDGEQIPGVVWAVPAADRFSIHIAGPDEL
jgi:phage host-nuclease inhibitor protein Gam